MYLSTRKTAAYAALISLSLIFSLTGCTHSVDHTPSSVKIVKQQDQFGLTVNGKPYDVKGVGLSYHKDEQLYALKEAGGNSYRTWGTHKLAKQLQLAEELDLMIAVGIDTGKELQGFDYNDEKAVAKQFERVKDTVLKYKDHPSVLAWVIANEPNLLYNEQGELIDVNPKVYKAMGDIIDFIHEVDPHHPVTFTFAGASERHIKTALKYAPNIDFISVQVYGDLATLGQAIIEMDIDKPFMVTEFGPTGHWETPSTAWGREIEETSAIKAEKMASRMNQAIVNDTTGQIIGSFAFLWGQKQERTPTWYGMFNASGEATARVDELSRIWTGSYPENRAPLSYSLSINDQLATDNISLAPNELVKATLTVTDPDADPLTTMWRYMEEVGVRSQGGHHEDKPSEFDLKVLSTTKTANGVSIEFKAPKTTGEYRLFSYSYDGNGHVANANVPFLVE